MRLSGGRFCETLLHLASIELLSRTQESQRKAEGLNSFKRLHCFKQNTNSKNKAGETSGGGKGSMVSCGLSGSKNKSSSPQP